VKLVGDHRARVEAMRGRGAVLDIRPSQAGRLDATRAFYASKYFRRAAIPQILPGLAGFIVSLILLLWAVLAPLLI
jgi:hypothetical protein